MTAPTPAVDFAIRLADEGVPLRAIARAVNLPSAAVREELCQAKNDGRLLELPREDWPPGFPRDQRALQLSRLVSEDRDLVHRVAAQVFGLTTMETRLLLALVQTPMVSRERSGIGGKVMDVHVHHLRKKLEPFGIAVQTLWGYGYQLSVPHRRKAIDVILQHAANLPSL
jgi:hypothetical protein